MNRIYLFNKARTLRSNS